MPYNNDQYNNNQYNTNPNNPYNSNPYNNNPNNNQYGWQQPPPHELFPSLWGNQDELNRATSSCLARVFMRMFVALLVTAAVSFGISQTPGLALYLATNPFLLIGVIIAQFALVLILSFRVMKMSPAVSNVMFFFYAILTGVTLSFIFLAYTNATIFQAFAVSALMFAAMAIYGTITHRDLTRIGSLCFMGLIGIIIASVVNMFFLNDTVFMIINYIGVLIFVGLTAYDTQRIKRMLAEANETNQEEAIKKISVIGALILYLDFINLFLKILHILGRRR